ncbi:MAG: SDR family NAD(P)-dependent oxidoreductase [Gammaproteobacteria bacterium]
MASDTTHGRLAGKVAVVTGASRGIGREIALGFAREGAAVALAARTEQVWNRKLPGTIYETAEAIAAAGGRAIAVRCDVTVEDDLIALVNRTREAFGRIDILINNAAITAPGKPPDANAAPAPARPAAPSNKPARVKGLTFLDMPVRGYASHFQTGTFAVLRLMQLVLPEMIERGRGAIVNISSGASQMPGEGPYPKPMPTFIAYGGNKAALEHLTRAAAAEMAQYGIAINSLSPSLAIATPGLNYYSPDLPEQMPMADFVEAALRLAIADPNAIAGWNVFSEDVLHPELGRRGWLGADGTVE